jgi:hypothetical protein
MEARLPAQLEVTGLIRLAQAEGGFAAVLQRGEREAGTILVVILENGANARLYERMPQLDGSRQWHCARQQQADNPADFSDYVTRRGQQDPDSWIVELDVPRGERLIGLTG